MLVKAVQAEGRTVEMYEGTLEDGFKGYIVMCDNLVTQKLPFNKAYVTYDEANVIFEMLRTKGGIWH